MSMSIRIETRILLLLVGFVMITCQLYAQETPPDETGAVKSDVISAENVARLASVLHVPFEAVEVDGETFDVKTGWFALSDDGRLAAVVRTDGGLLIFDTVSGALVDTYTLTFEDAEFASDVIDARFNAAGDTLAALHNDGGQRYAVALHTVGGETRMIDFPENAGIPVRVWFDAAASYAEAIYAEAPYVWVESTPDYLNPEDEAYRVVRLPLTEADEQDIVIQPSAPEADPDAFVRIGRITVPLAVTATPEGLVKLWDLESGEVLTQVQLDETPVFGRINETTRRQMVWRDQISQALHVLDFDTGENQRIADIGGDYIQAIMLTPDNSAILAVHIGEAADVAAWLTASGERVDLDGYWDACSRVPDMVRISADGRTLVIGCDAGLDVWRVE